MGKGRRLRSCAELRGNVTDAISMFVDFNLAASEVGVKDLYIRALGIGRQAWQVWFSMYRLDLSLLYPLAVYFRLLYQSQLEPHSL